MIELDVSIVRLELSAVDQVDFALRQGGGQPRSLGEPDATQHRDTQSAVAVAFGSAAEHVAFRRDRGIADQDEWQQPMPAHRR